MTEFREPTPEEFEEWCAYINQCEAEATTYFESAEYRYDCIPEELL